VPFPLVPAGRVPVWMCCFSRGGLWVGIFLEWCGFGMTFDIRTDFSVCVLVVGIVNPVLRFMSFSPVGGKGFLRTESCEWFEGENQSDVADGFVCGRTRCSLVLNLHGRCRFRGFCSRLLLQIP